jgi:hypothetical protein
MPQAIEIHRMVIGVESCIVDVDDETLDRVKNKTISRSELDELMFDEYIDIDIHENERPHIVYIIHKGGLPSVIDYEDQPDE